MSGSGGGIQVRSFLAAFQGEKPSSNCGDHDDKQKAVTITSGELSSSSAAASRERTRHTKLARKAQ
jgi:hypothetical protein